MNFGVCGQNLEQKILIGRCFFKEYQNKTLHRVFTRNKVLNVAIFMQNED